MQADACNCSMCICGEGSFASVDIITDHTYFVKCMTFCLCGMEQIAQTEKELSFPLSKSCVPGTAVNITSNLRLPVGTQSCFT